MQKKLFLSLSLLFIVVKPLFSQLSVANRMEYTHWEKYNRNILENWLDVSYQESNYSFGLRHEINKPPDPFIFPMDSLLNQNELTFKYAEMYKGNFTLRVGNYYAMFGRGMVLRTYEDRNLRVDNNIEGVKANYYNDFLEITALGGRIRDKYNRRGDRVFGMDGEFNLGNVKLGASFLRNQKSDNSFSEISALRFNPSFRDFDLYGEIAYHKKLSHYYALSYSRDRFTLLAEYKNYYQLSFSNDLSVEYNTPPALSREHSYSLLNRHPHVLNANDERGYQFEGTMELSEDTSLLLNYSYTESQKSARLFEEYYGQLTTDLFSAWHVESALGWNFDFTTGTKNLTPVFMAEYSWASIHQLHFEYQHQHVTNTVDKSEFDNELALIEYTRAPFLSVAIVSEYSNRYKLVNVQDTEKFWLYGQITLEFLENQQLTLLYGSRQAGFVCAGGVCRYEPEFKGFELKLDSRF